MSKTVVVVQPYIAAYRRPFFLALRERLLAADINLVVAAGRPAGSQAARQDEIDLPGLVRLRERQISLRGRSIAHRNFGTALDGADLVVLEQARRNLEMYQLLLGPRRNRQVALWGHGRTVSREASRWEHRLLDSLTKRADWFFAYTDAGAQHAVATGFPEDRCTVVRNTTDTSALREAVDAVTDAEVRLFEKKHGLSSGMTSLFVGGLDVSKRIDFLLRAVAQVQGALPAFKLIVAGRGTDEGKVASAQACGLPVVALGDCRGRELAVAARSSQLLLMPGRVGLVAVDSFAMGLPIVTTDWPHHAPEFDYLRSEVDSVVTANCVDDFSEAVRRLMTFPRRRSSLAEAARQRCRDFSIDSMAERFADGVTNCLRTRP